MTRRTSCRQNPCSRGRPFNLPRATCQAATWIRTFWVGSNRETLRPRLSRPGGPRCARCAGAMLAETRSADGPTAARSRYDSTMRSVALALLISLTWVGFAQSDLFGNGPWHLYPYTDPITDENRSAIWVHAVEYPHEWGAGNSSDAVPTPRIRASKLPSLHSRTLGQKTTTLSRTASIGTTLCSTRGRLQLMVIPFCYRRTPSRCSSGHWQTLQGSAFESTTQATGTSRW